MTQEEKAKAYDEALEQAKKYHEKYWQVDAKDITETLFPQLRENEDERMLVEFNDWLCDEIEFRTSSLCDEKDRRTLEMLCYVLTNVKDWLEKQKKNHDGKKWIYEDDYHKDMERSFNDGKDEVLENPEKYGLQREQKPVEWSEKDEKIIDTIISVLGQYINYSSSGYATPMYSKEIDFLKSLRPSQKQDCSEDERIRKGLIEVVSDIAGGWPFEKHRITKKEAITYLERRIKK